MRTRPGACEASATSPRSRSRVPARLADVRAGLPWGWRVPIAGVSGTGGVHYQNVGLAVTLHGRRVEDDRIRAAGEVELSSIDRVHLETAAGLATPTVDTFRYVFDVVLDDDVTTVLAEVPNPEGGTVTLSVLAELPK